MYYCLGRKDNNFIVIDSDDNVEEEFTFQDIKAYLEQGVQILGVTLDSLTLNDTALILIDFPSKVVREGKVFNGFYFIDYDLDSYNDLHNSYLYSVVTDLSIDDVVSSISYIQRVNNVILGRILSNFSKGLKVRYTIDYIFDNGVLNVKDNITGEIFGFSYSDICYVLDKEKVTIEGLNLICGMSASINDREFTLEDSIKYSLEQYTGVSSGCYFELNKENRKQIDILYLHSNDLDSFIKDSRDMFLTVSNFPMVSLHDYLKEDSLYESTLSDILSLIQDDVDFVERKANKFVFSNGDVLDDSVAIKVYKAYKGRQPEFYNAVKSYIDIRNAKLKLSGLDHTEENDLPSFRFNDEYITKTKYNGVLEEITTNPEFDCRSTSFGSIITSTYIRKDYNQKLSKVGGIEIFRLTHAANYYYRIGRSGITIHLNSSNSKYQARNIINSSFSDIISLYRDNLGYYYDRPNIMPLFVHNVKEDEEGVEINILVAVNSNDCRSFISSDEAVDFSPKEKKMCGWGSLLLVVPLLLTGTRHYISGDFVIFDLLFQELAISKDVYNNMIVDIDDFNDLICIDKCSEVSSSKECNCCIGDKNTKTSGAIKRVIKGEMRAFNKSISAREYFI